MPDTIEYVEPRRRLISEYTPDGEPILLEDGQLRRRLGPATDITKQLDRSGAKKERHRFKEGVRVCVRRAIEQHLDDHGMVTAPEKLIERVIKQMGLEE